VLGLRRLRAIGKIAAEGLASWDVVFLPEIFDGGGRVETKVLVGHPDEEAFTNAWVDSAADRGLVERRGELVALTDAGNTAVRGYEATYPVAVPVESSPRVGWLMRLFRRWY
jgi:hypothetical protein